MTDSPAIRAVGDTPATPRRRRAPKQYVVSVYPGRAKPLPVKLGASLAELEKNLGLPVWVIAQGTEDGPFAQVDDYLFDAFHQSRGGFPADTPIALVVNSYGGDARAAYNTARLLQRRCGYMAVVPRAAMSAATLLVLGADEILMGRDAALGPLDAQVFDPDSETFASALNEVQALERLRAYALESIDETMFLLIGRTGKKIDSLLPHVLRFVAESNRPLLEKIDVVHYNERARVLKIGEEYAVRLLRRRFPAGSSADGQDPARAIASHLVEKYPEHGFPIDVDEARSLGIEVSDPTAEQLAMLEELWYQLEGMNVIGRVEEVVADAR